MSFSLPRINVPDPVYPDLAGAQQRGQQFQSNQLAMMMQRQQFEDQQQQRNAFAQYGAGLGSDDPTKRMNVLNQMMQAAPGMGTQLVPMIASERDARDFSAAIGGSATPAAAAARPAPPSGMPGQGAAMPAAAPPGDPSLPRGLRNNNPLNLTYVAGQPGVQGSDGRFGRYATPEDGIAASVRQLQMYGQRGLTTLPQIINRWAPPSENDTGAYVARVAQASGIDPRQPINLQDPAVVQRLIEGMSLVENGRPLDSNVSQRGVAAAFGLPRGPTTQAAPAGASPDVTTIADGAPPAASSAGTVPTAIPTTTNGLPSRERLAAIAVLAGRGNQNAARYLQAIQPLLGGETQLERIRLPDNSERLVPRAQAAGMISAAPPPTTDVQVLLPQWRALQDLGASATPTQAAERDLLAQRLRGSGVNVNVDQRGERAEATGRGTSLAQEGERIRLAAETAAGTVDTVRQVRALDANTDRLAPTREVIGGYLDAVGITPAQSRLVREATTAQTFEAAAASVILGRQMEQRGVQTDGDANRMRQTFASLRNTTGANDFILRATEAQATRTMERAEFYQEWRQRPGPNGEPRNTLDGASEAWNRYIRETPLVAQAPNAPAGISFLSEYLTRASERGVAREDALTLWREFANQRPGAAR